MNDDFVNQIEGNTRADIIKDTPLKADVRDYCLSLGMGLRDDSLIAGPDKFERDFHTISTPEMFDMFYKQAPIDIEAGHIVSYSFDDGKGGFRLLDGAKRSHATYAGFHGYIEDWLPKNQYLTEYLANRLGYWYFIKSISHNSCTDSGVPFKIGFEWENAGYGLCYTKYELEVKLSCNDKSYICKAKGFDNTKFMNESVSYTEVFADLPEDMAEGRYDIKIRVSEGETPIKLGIKAEFMDDDGFYRLSEVDVLKYTL